MRVCVFVWPTRCILGLVDGDSGAGQGQAAGVLQSDVDTVDARLQKRSPETHLTLWGWRHIIAHNVTHLCAAGVWHNGAGWRGGAEDEAWEDEELVMKLAFHCLKPFSSTWTV